METSRLEASVGFQCQEPCSVWQRWAPCDSFCILSPTYPCPILAPTYQRRDLLVEKGLLGTLACRLQRRRCGPS